MPLVISYDIAGTVQIPGWKMDTTSAVIEDGRVCIGGGGDRCRLGQENFILQPKLGVNVFGSR